MYKKHKILKYIENKELPLMLAHRGYSGKYPENTKIAFNQALKEAGFDGLEMDVRLTKDNQAAVIHDATIDRTNSNKRGKVSDWIMSELKKINFNGDFLDYKGFCEIMSFDEFYDEYIGKANILNIEIKDDSLKLRDIIYEKVRRYEGSIIYINTKHSRIAEWFLNRFKGSNYILVSYRPDDLLDLIKEEVERYDFLDCHERRYLENPNLYNDITTLKTVFLKTSSSSVYSKMVKVDKVVMITGNFPKNYFINKEDIQ